jgi:phosphoribosylformylglycinamidine synthase
LNEASQPRFVHNDSGRFESRWTHVRIGRSQAVLLQGMQDSTFGVWVAHGEGKLVFPDPGVLTEVQSKLLVPLTYVGAGGRPTQLYPDNPNGSLFGYAGLCSPDGRHLAMMPHPERCFLKWQWPWMPEDWKNSLEASPWLRMFQNARTWCMENRIH